MSKDIISVIRDMKKKQKPDDPEESDPKPPDAPSVTQTCKNEAANQPLKRGQKVITLTSSGLTYVLPACHGDALIVSPEQTEEDEGQIQRSG